MTSSASSEENVTSSEIMFTANYFLVDDVKVKPCSKRFKVSILFNLEFFYTILEKKGSLVVPHVEPLKVL